MAKRRKGSLEAPARGAAASEGRAAKRHPGLDTTPLGGRGRKAAGSGPGTQPATANGAPAKSAQAARRQAILHAGMRVFAEHGFEAARLDDVAARAGVAKGTLYLYFKDKTSLFEEIIRDAVTPLIARFEQLASLPDLPTAQVLDGIYALFLAEVLSTERKLLLRLIISEGPRFPAIAEFYHREVVSRGLGLIRGLAARAVARGEVADDALQRFPQLVLSAPLLAVLWDGLFARIEPLDAAGLMRAQRDLLTRLPAPSSTRSPSP